MLLDLRERNLVSALEPIPWKAKIVAADMGVLILSRLPQHAMRHHIESVFGHMPYSNDSMYMSVPLPSTLFGSRPYWYVIFHLDPRTGYLQQLEINKVSGK